MREKFRGSLKRPQNFKLLCAFDEKLIEFNEEEERTFKRLWGGGDLPPEPADVTREVTGRLTAAFNTSKEAQKVATCLTSNGLVKEG